MEAPDRASEAPLSLIVPTDPGFFHVVRSLCTAVASMLEIPMDTVEDQRLAVSEACNLLVARVPSAQSLMVEMWPSEDSLRVSISVDTGGLPSDLGAVPEFSWTIIRQLAPEAAESNARGRQAITMTWPTLITRPA